jgi:hypothetical protein
MNLKVANLIAIQLGIFVGIMSWLAYSRLESAGPRSAAEARKTAVEPVAPARPASPAEEQGPSAVDNRTDRDEASPNTEQPAPVMQHEYSPAAVQQNSALAAQLYYQQIAPRRYASSGSQDPFIVAKAPSYTEVEQAPAVVADEPAPQTVAYVEPTQVVVYPQPQFILFSNSRRFANRCRPTSPVIGENVARTHRRADRPRTHLSGSTHSTSLSAGLCRPAKSFGVVQRRNDKVASCGPTQGFGSRGRR